MRAGSLVIVSNFHWNQLKHLEGTLGFDMVERRRKKKEERRRTIEKQNTGACHAPV